MLDEALGGRPAHDGPKAVGLLYIVNVSSNALPVGSCGIGYPVFALLPLASVALAP